MLKIILTGSPGTGKSSVAKILGKKLKAVVVNDADFCKKNRIGVFDKKAKERVVPTERLEKKLNAFFKKLESQESDGEKNKWKKGGKKPFVVIAEGHLLCECRLKADVVFLLRVSPKTLEARLSKRGYPAAKLLDNVFCEETGYCKTRVLRNYPANKLVEIVSSDSAEKTAKKILDCPALRG